MKVGGAQQFKVGIQGKPFHKTAAEYRNELSDVIRNQVLDSFHLQGIPYRVVIIPMKKLSIAMTTVNPWVCVSGELGNSGVRQIPKNTQEIFFQVSTSSSCSWALVGKQCKWSHLTQIIHSDKDFHFPLLLCLE